MTWSDLRTGGSVVCRVLASVGTGFASLLSGRIMARFQLKPDDVIVERRPNTMYERLAPYHVELCAASEFRSKLTGEGGGVAGHAVLYLKGACKDENAHSHSCGAAAWSLCTRAFGEPDGTTVRFSLSVTYLQFKVADHV